MNKVMGRAAMGLSIISMALWCASALGQATPKDGGPVVVLDTLSVWRIHETLKPPLLQLDDGLTPVTSAYAWLDRETAAAPADWTKPDFPDGNWLHGGARATSRTPYLADLCLRARFEVTDPVQVPDLKLSLTYYGGAIVYVNGQEVVRGHVAKDRTAVLAEGYLPEAFVAADGKMLPAATWQMDRFPKGLAARARTLTDVAIPPQLLRKGVNVLAIEIIRAPYHKILDKMKNRGEDNRELAKRDLAVRNCPYELAWNTCELRRVQLTAAGATGLVPNAARPPQLQAWSSDILTADYSSDFADRCEPLPRVELKGPGNGFLSGKIVIGSPQAITGLKVTCSDLKQSAGVPPGHHVLMVAGMPAKAGTPTGEAVIPAANMRARYAVPFGRTAGNGDDHANNAVELDCLLETPLESFPATAAGKGAVVPIWLTLKAPKDAKPGVYTGQVTVAAEGAEAHYFL